MVSQKSRLSEDRRRSLLQLVGRHVRLAQWLTSRVCRDSSSPAESGNFCSDSHQETSSNVSDLRWPNVAGSDTSRTQCASLRVFNAWRPRCLKQPTLCRKVSMAGSRTSPLIQVSFTLRSSSKSSGARTYTISRERHTFARVNEIGETRALAPHREAHVILAPLEV